MNRELAMKVADAVLYEGYMLYPYRRSALKNRQRWAFGTLYPPDYQEVRRGTERSSMHSECLLKTAGIEKVEIQLRFLQIVTPGITSSTGENADDSSNEAVERSVKFEWRPQLGSRQRFEFSFLEQAGDVSREDSDAHRLWVAVIIKAEVLEPSLRKLTVEVANETFVPSGDLEREKVLQRSFLLAHLILVAEGGEFVSLLDPPDELRDPASRCRNVGNFPVLLGKEGEHEMMLCSPIILYDYPQIAPESAGDFFDATEMDEMLTLRVMTLTDEEKKQMRMGDEHTRRLLERTEQSAREQLRKTHGAIRSSRPSK